MVYSLDNYAKLLVYEKPGEEVSHSNIESIIMKEFGYEEFAFQFIGDNIQVINESINLDNSIFENCTKSKIYTNRKNRSTMLVISGRDKNNNERIGIAIHDPIQFQSRIYANQIKEFLLEENYECYFEEEILENVVNPKNFKIYRLGSTENTYYDCKTMQLIIDGKNVAIQSTERKLFLYLAKNLGETKTKGEILKHVWGTEDYIDPKNLTIQITHLRKKLGDDPYDPKYIFTEWGVGYRIENVTILDRSMLNQPDDENYGSINKVSDSKIYRLEYTDNAYYDCKTMQLIIDGKNAKIRPKTRDLFLYLAENLGETKTKEDILEHVWGNEVWSTEDYYIDPQNVRIQINYLRENLGDDPHNPKYIFTVWGVGYRIENVTILNRSVLNQNNNTI